MAVQVTTSICTGMDEVGKERLRLYRTRSRERGFHSLSEYLVTIADRDLGLELPKTGRGRRARPVDEKNEPAEMANVASNRQKVR